MNCHAFVFFFLLAQDALLFSREVACQLQPRTYWRLLWQPVSVAKTHVVDFPMWDEEGTLIY